MLRIMLHRWISRQVFDRRHPRFGEFATDRIVDAARWYRGRALPTSGFRPTFTRCPSNATYRLLPWVDSHMSCTPHGSGGRSFPIRIGQGESSIGGESEQLLGVTCSTL